MSQETGTKTSALGRGRPRPQEAIERDAMILSCLKDNGPQTRNTLRDGLGLSDSITYLSLSRLRRQGLVKLCQGAAGDRQWSADVNGPCP